MGHQRVNRSFRTTRHMFGNEKNDTRTYPKLFKWHINFDGSGSVLDFIDKVEDRIYSRGATESEVLQGFTDILEGSALIWFRSIRTYIDNWESLKDALILKYEQLNYRPRLENELRNSKQLDHESMNDFITRLDTMNARLTPRITDMALLEIIKMNVSPKYHTLLGTTRLSHVGELLDLAKNFEQYMPNIGNVASTGSQQRQNLPKEAKYKSIAAFEDTNMNPAGSISYSQEEREIAAFQYPNANITRYPKQVVNPPSNQIRNHSGISQQQCLKCDRLGHGFRECRKYPNTMCFKCKTEFTTTRECRNCNNMLRQNKGNQSKN